MVLVRQEVEGWCNSVDRRMDGVRTSADKSKAGNPTVRDITLDDLPTNTTHYRKFHTHT